MMRKRAGNNQVRSISSMQSESEGHKADFIADYIFSVMLEVRFRR